jgi:hypothetical protein
MRCALIRSALFALALAGLFESPVLAQGGSAKSTITGTVLDTAGGVLPGATVVVKNAATSVETTTVTNSSGAFDVPALDAGTYTITISLSGFRTSVLTAVELLAATTRSVKATLEVGQLTEAVEVRGGAQLVQTQSTAVSSTIRADQMATLPLVARNALNFVVFLPGVDTSSNNHSQRQSTIMGLPQSTLSITVDGSNVQDKYTRSGDGFFANLQPRLDMVEEVTVSSATAGADSSGQGAVQIKFVTRSGTNKFVGSVYEYTRHQNLNSNTWLNLRNGLPRNVLVLNQYGGREGGPIVIPGWYDGRGKAFFFVNMEQLRFPLSNTRNRIMLSEQAQQGVFRYAVSGATRQVNLFEVAARTGPQGQTSTPDPTIAALLARIRSGTGTTGIVNNRTDPNTQDFVWQPESLRIDNVPTVRLDFNLGSAHRLSTSFSYQGQRLTPNLFGGDDPNFPGLANQAELYSAISRSSTTLRSTFGKSLVNEVRVGWSNGPVYFADSVNTGQFEDQAGFDLVFPNVGSALTGATTNRGHQSRNGKSWNLDNTVNWLKGRHSVQLGAAFTRTSGWMENQNLVPQISFGVDTTNDPANAMFVDANFPGASNADFNNARALYAFLTGRVVNINSEVRLDGATGQYTYMGLARTAEHQDELGLFIQDSWRLRPNVTINAGLRWQLAFPFRADASVYSMNAFEDLCGVSGPGNGPQGRGCNLFNPGVFNAGGRIPTYQAYAGGDAGYKTEYDNFAPNVGVAWLPGVKSGWLRGLLGDPDLATVRASFGVAYNSDGLSFFRDVYNANPGSTVSTTRSATSAQFPLVPAGQSWPVLLRETSRLGPSANIPTAPVYPMAINFNNGVNLLDPAFRTPLTRSYSVGLQRALSKLMVVEVRYVGTRLVDGTTTENWNCANGQVNNCPGRNFTSNGFLDEFRLAQQNLQVAIAQGCGQAGRPACSFAYQGPGTGTFPLPIYLGNFNGTPRGQSGEAARYTGNNWIDTARLAELAARNPNPGAAVNALYASAAFRTSFEAAGYPRNFFVLNPDVTNANITTNGRTTTYDALQINLRRLLSAGLTLDTNYTYASRTDTRLEDLRVPRRRVRSDDAVPHALKVTANYELPFGRGKRFAGNASGWVDGLAGNWSLNMTGRVQSGSILNFGNVRVVGMSIDELEDAFKIRIDPTTRIVYTLPQDIIDNTIRAFSTNATSATGYGALGAPTGRYLAPANGPDCIQQVRGDCAPADLFVEGPIFTRFDLNVKKRVPFAGTRSVEIGVDVLNLFNAINFTAVAQAGSGATINQVTQSYQDPNVTFDPGGRLVQLVFRVNF